MIRKRYMEVAFFAYAYSTKHYEVVCILIDYKTEDELIEFIQRFKHSTVIEVVVMFPKSFGKRAKTKVTRRYWVDHKMWE